MSARLTGMAILLVGVFGGSTLAASEAEIRARVDGLLGAYRAVTVAQWRALGSAAAPVLESVARDPSAVPTRRARALAALGVVQPAAAGPLIRQLVAETTAPVVLRCAAVDVAPGVLGPGASDVLVPLLRDPEALVRLGSARVLAASGASGCRAVAAEARSLPSSDPVARTAASCEAQLRAAPPGAR
jgi:HEAT repeat protein